MRGSNLATSASGHSLLELVIAIAIVGVLASIGWWAVQDEVDRYRMMKAARLMQSDVQMMRALAIATNREARIVFLAADDALDPVEPQVGEWLLQVGDRSTGSTEWDTLPIDVDGGADGSEGERSLSPEGPDEAPHVSLAPWPELRGPSVGNEDAVVFSPRGWLGNPAEDFTDGYVSLRFVNKYAVLRGGPEEARVRISRGGLARLEVSDSSSLPENTVGTAEASSP